MSGQVRVHVSFIVKDEKNFLPAAKKLVESIKGQKGCVSTGLFKHLGDCECNYAIIETWEDEASVDADNNSEHVSKFLEEQGDNITVNIQKFAPA